MELTELQRMTKNHVLKVFEDKKCYLIADEVGLGKTNISGEIISELAKKKQVEKPDNPFFIVYYICGNERVTTQNCQKLREICNGVETKDERLSMQWVNTPDYLKKGGVLVFPLTPATTFTHKNSEFNMEEAENQNNFAESFKIDNDTKEALLKKFEELFPNEKKNSPVADTAGRLKYYVGLKKNSEKNVSFETAQKKEVFKEIREFILEYTIKNLFKPDFILLDEFQNYSDLLYGKEKNGNCKYPLFRMCLKEAKHVLMLSATPYEMTMSEVRSMSPFDDGLGLTGEKAAENEEEEEQLFSEGENKSFDQMKNFIVNCPTSEEKNAVEKKDGVVENTEYLYNNVFCRSERSMFYNMDKESEIEYVYCNAKRELKHLNYTAEVYKLYKEAYEKANMARNFPGAPSDAFISYIKECPAPARFATRYKSLKYEKSDYNFYNELDKRVFSNQGHPDPFEHSSLSLLKEQACPDGIEKLLWIPPAVFEAEEEENPFRCFKNYTKSLVFGNYRLSTAAPACLISDYIRKKQVDLVSKAELPPLAGKIKLDDKNWWPFEDIQNEGKAAREALRELVKVYLERNLDIIRAVTNKKSPEEVQEAVEQYAAWGDLKNVIQEYAFLLGLSRITKSGEKERNKINKTIRMLNAMREYFADKGPAERKDKLSPTKVIYFTNDENCNDKVESSDATLRERCYYECGFAERFTEDNTDQNAHIKLHQQNLQNLFNSPFYPFIIASTSVAQEGLDFHNYCHRIVHWSVAKTPIAYEQREGRIDRYLSHLVRKRIAICGEGENFEERLEYVNGKKKELEEKMSKKPLFPYWYLGEEEYKVICGNEPLADWPKFIRVICALPNSRESRYFAKLRAALKNYNYYIGPTYQGEEKTDRNFCPLIREETNKQEIGE